MKICIASDHAGYFLKEKIKEYLKRKEIDCVDFGTESNKSVDYPDYAHKVGKAVNEGIYPFGIVLCGSGNGVNMVVNKYENVRGALCWNKEIAELARKHNNANVLALPARFMEEGEALQIVKIFLETAFEGGRHTARVEKIKIKKEG